MPTRAPAPVREAPVSVQVAPPAPRVFTPPAPEPVESPFTFKPAVAPAPVAVPTPRPDPMPAPVVERPAPAAPRPAVQTYVPPAPRTEPVPFLYAPFVGFNAVLNWTLGLFGFPGRVLRSGFIKSLFGLAGIGLLAYTGLKVAQIHGLVTLPQELPWPR